MNSQPEAGSRRTSWLCLALFVFGLSQMVGYLLDLPALRGIGAASQVAPFPKVFSDVDGLETFASEFELCLSLEIDDEAKHDCRAITPELYSRLRGPYPRRNVYGAALAYAPRLPDELWQPVFCFGFNGPLIDELGLPSPIRDAEVTIRTRTAGRNDRWTYTMPCPVAQRSGDR